MAAMVCGGGSGICEIWEFLICIVRASYSGEPQG